VFVFEFFEFEFLVKFVKNRLVFACLARGVYESTEFSVSFLLVMTPVDGLKKEKVLHSWFPLSSTIIFR